MEIITTLQTANMTIVALWALLVFISLGTSLYLLSK